MSRYPAAAGQGLYQASATQKHRLGEEYAFDTANGVVHAVYVKNVHTTTINGGVWVGHEGAADSVFCEVNMNYVNNASWSGGIVGMLCATLTSNYYGWAAYRGPVTVARFGHAPALSTALRRCSINTDGVLSTCVTNSSYIRVGGSLRVTTTTVASTGGDGAIVDLYWR